MKLDASGFSPQWLQRSDSPQPFVLTVCTSADPVDLPALLAGCSDDIEIGAQHRFSPTAAQTNIDCRPSSAWTLLTSLRASAVDMDVYLQPKDGLGKRLLICDMDMTIVAAETLDEVAAILGMGEKIAAITARAMHGEIDFNAALRERIAMLAGQPEQVFHDLAKQVPLNPGAERLLASAAKAGVHTILISGGFAQVAEPVAKLLGFDEVHCNRLEISDGKLTGKVIEPIVNADFKCALLKQRAQALGLTLDDCCAIGDGANDLPMLDAAGLGIAYHAKPILRAATDCHIDATNLASAIYFMGYE